MEHKSKFKSGDRVICTINGDTEVSFILGPQKNDSPSQWIPQKNSFKIIWPELSLDARLSQYCRYSYSEHFMRHMSLLESILYG